jgi:hypothetical protein
MRASTKTKALFDETNESAQMWPRQQMLTAKSKSNYNFIIYGSGPSGSVVARETRKSVYACSKQVEAMMFRRS